MKKINIIYLFLMLVVLGSCERTFLDVNTDPNSPSDASITSDLLLPSALLKTGTFTTASGRGTLGTFARWCGIWAPSSDFAAGEESKYLRQANTSNGTWFSIYDQNAEFKAIEDRSKANGETFYQGIALIMQSLNYQMGVDMFNDMPYSQALTPTILAPKYDKGEDIYMDLLKKIDQGINLINAADASKNFNLTNGDILKSSADLNKPENRKKKWAKFGNTLKLRILIHMSQMPSISAIAAAEIAKINAEGSGFLGAGETIGINPGFIVAKPNPFWSSFTYDQANNAPNTFNRANNFSLNAMKSLNDERYKYFYKPVQGTPGTLPIHWLGIDYAITNSDPTKRASVLSDIGGAPTPTGPAVGLGKSATMDCWILTAAESFFLQAEARVRGWAVSGTASSLYQSGVTESFAWLGVPSAASTAAAYLAQPDPRVAFGTTADDNLRAIAWQKYFAFNGNTLLEVWTDYRRLHIIPNTPIVNIPLSTDPGRGSNAIPVRLPYPQTEYDFNTSNANAAGGKNIQSDKIFWDR
jgi:Starch-binding associating with outer membrane